MQKQLICIGGPMGVGKTTVCRQMQARRDHCVFLDGDWCWDAHPFINTPETRAMAVDNIRHLLNGFLGCTAYETVLFCWVFHQADILPDDTYSLGGLAVYLGYDANRGQHFENDLLAVMRKARDVTERVFYGLS